MVTLEPGKVVRIRGKVTTGEGEFSARDDKVTVSLLR
jgi:hypothetical protein